MVPPILQAILLADQVYKDADSGKRIICGTFNAVTSREYPCQIEGRKVFLSFTAITGSVSIKLRFVHLADYSILGETEEVELPSLNPLFVVELVSGFPPVSIPEPGAYALEVLCDEQILGSVRIQANPIEPLPSTGESI